LEKRKSSVKKRKADFWSLESLESTDRRKGGGVILVKKVKKA